MDEIYVYFVRLPPGVYEMVTPCADGFTVYIDEALDREHKLRAYAHAVEHIRHGDFERGLDVDRIEKERHAG